MSDKMNNINKLISHIKEGYRTIFTDEMTEQAQKYLFMKGLDKYKVCLEQMKKNYPNVETTYQNVSVFYRYDQRIIDNLNKYIGLIEEYLRSLLNYLCKIKSIAFIKKFEKKNFLVNNFEVLMINTETDEKLDKLFSSHFNRKRNETKNGVYDFFESLSLSDLGKFCSIIKKDEINFFSFDSLTDIVDIRNKIAHNRFIHEVYSPEELANHLYKIYLTLPGEEYEVLCQSFNYKKGFLETIEKLNLDKKVPLAPWLKNSVYNILIKLIDGNK